MTHFDVDADTGFHTRADEVTRVTRPGLSFNFHFTSGDKGQTSPYTGWPVYCNIVLPSTIIHIVLSAPYLAVSPRKRPEMAAVRLYWLIARRWFQAKITAAAQ